MDVERKIDYLLARLWAVEYIAIVGLIRAHRGNRKKAQKATEELKDDTLELLNQTVENKEELEMYQLAIHDCFATLTAFCSPEEMLTTPSKQGPMGESFNKYKSIFEYFHNKT